MLQALFFALVGALICRVAISLVVFIIYKKENLYFRLIWEIVWLFIDFIYMGIVLYTSCIEQTIISVMRWMWPILLVEVVLLLFLICLEGVLYDVISSFVLCVISGIFCMITLFGPVQNLTYAYDMQDVDVTFAISSDEILAKVELKIDNSINGRDKYYVRSPEMRKIDGKFIAVYHIINKDDSCNDTDYIPGYAIQEQRKLPQIVSKRIYFDTSYVNQRDALRTVRRKYPTLVIGNNKFDIDDDWNPYEVFEYRENRLFSNGKDYGLIILNLRDGTCEKYCVADNNIPDWVDFKTTYPR